MKRFQIFYGREPTLKQIEDYMLGTSNQPIVFYGEGGCGKTSLLAKSAAFSASTWFADRRPVSIIRFLGTTPDSSALTPTLISICQQVIACYLPVKRNIISNCKYFFIHNYRYLTTFPYHLKKFLMI